MAIELNTNLDYVRKGQDMLLSILSGYIGKEMNQAYRTSWWDEIVIALEYPKDLKNVGNDYQSRVDSLDLANCLRVIDRKWNDLFRYKLAYNCRLWTKELMGVRNVVAHAGNLDMTQADAERALDTMERLCREIDEETAADIHELYLSVRGTTDTQAETVQGGYYETVSQKRKVIEGDEFDLFGFIDTDMVEPTSLSRKLTIDGETKAYPVYRVRLDLLFYNNQNDRIATWISQYENEPNNTPLFEMSVGEYNDIIEEFIIDSNPAAIQKTKNNIALVNQREPGVVLSDGRIIDGNRRFTCLRLLSKDNPEMNYFETVILSAEEVGQKQIKMLELAIQHGEEQRVDYSLIDMAIGAYHDIVETELLTVAEYARSTNETTADVNKRLEVAQLINEFLQFMNVPGQYHIAREKQVYSIFNEFIPLLKKCSGTLQQQELKNSIFQNAMMESVADQRKYIRDVKAMLNSGMLNSYLKHQNKLFEELETEKAAYGIQNKAELDNFVKEHEDIAKELELSYEKALMQSKKTQTKNKAAKNVEKSAESLLDIDTRIFDKLTEEEKDGIRNQLGRLKQIIEMIEKEL